MIVWQHTLYMYKSCTLSSRLEDGSRVWLPSIPKGLIISSQSASNWSLLPYRLHHLSHKSLGKTEQTIYFGATPESLCAKANSKYSVSKVLLRNAVDQWKIISKWWNFCDEEYFDCISEVMKYMYVAPSPQACKHINHMIPELDLKS